MIFVDEADKLQGPDELQSFTDHISSMTETYAARGVILVSASYSKQLIRVMEKCKTYELVGHKENTILDGEGESALEFIQRPITVLEDTHKSKEGAKAFLLPIFEKLLERYNTGHRMPVVLIFDRNEALFRDLVAAFVSIMTHSKRAKGLWDSKRKEIVRSIFPKSLSLEEASANLGILRAIRKAECLGDPDSILITTVDACAAYNFAPVCYPILAVDNYQKSLRVSDYTQIMGRSQRTDWKAKKQFGHYAFHKQDGESFQGVLNSKESYKDLV